MEELILECQEKMTKCIVALESSLSTIRAGRVSPSVFEEIKCDYYGEKTPITYVATITLSGPNQFVIKPFDRGDVKSVVAAINESSLGVNPIADGDSVRLNFPTLTEERRKEFAKTSRKYGEESKVAIRNIRREFNDLVKKDKEIPEDMAKRLENDIQKTTDEFIKKIDNIVAKKEADIMEI